VSLSESKAENAEKKLIKISFIRKLLIFITFISAEIFASSISCENFYNNHWSVIGKVKICEMRGVTTIDAEGFEVASPDDSITGLNFEFNKKISFLPIGVHKAFQNLLGYSAHSCSLTTISRNNFKGLIRLKLLLLEENQITTIYSDTFADLISLKHLDLSKKINFYY
jgi:Leucine-rich repeat (LRR) protein